MKRSSFSFAAVLAVACLFTGCSTIDSRIKEKSAAFVAADPATQESLRKGAVQVGYSPDLVYIALGKPDEQFRSSRRTGSDATWVYNSYTQEYAGTAQTGYRRYIVIDPRSGQPVVYLEPVYTNVYRQHIDERIRIIFKDGKVSAIEEVKDR